MNKMKKRKTFSLEPSYLVLTVFIILLFSRGVIRALGGDANEHIVVTVLQILTFALPAAIWGRLRSMPKFATGKGYFSKLRIKPLKLRNVAATVSATFALIFGGLLLSIGFSGGSSLSGSFSLYDIFVSKYDGTWLGALWLILAYAILPAVCEEFLFRGILTVEYEKYGPICAAVTTSVWFAFLHFSFLKLPIYLFAGLVLSQLLYTTRSLVATIIAHFVYNLFGIFGQQYITDFYITSGTAGVAALILFTLLVASVALFCLFASKLYRARAGETPDAKALGRDEIVANFRAIATDPAAIIAALVFLAAAVVFIFV